MTEEQKKRAALIRRLIREKGITVKKVSEMVGIHNMTLIKILSGTQPALKEELLDRIHAYVYLVNTNDIDV